MINGYIIITLGQYHLLRMLISPQDCAITQTLLQENNVTWAKIPRHSPAAILQMADTFTDTDISKCHF